MGIKTTLTREELAKSKFFSCDDDAERLTATSIEEAVEMAMEDWDPDDARPERITVYGFSPMKVNWDYLNPLERCLEQLDDDYGDPDLESKPTPAMLQAEKALIEAIKTGYMVYMCNADGFTVIPTAEFFKE